LFDGTLGDWKLKPVSLELKEGSVPYSTRPYPIPEKYFETTRKEINRLCNIGVLKRQRESEWGSPTFITPKKDQTVHVVSDFRRLNKIAMFLASSSSSSSLALDFDVDFLLLSPQSSLSQQHPC
jgi:hypothetical protein